MLSVVKDDPPFQVNCINVYWNFYLIPWSLRHYHWTNTKQILTHIPIYLLPMAIRAINDTDHNWTATGHYTLLQFYGLIVLEGLLLFIATQAFSVMFSEVIMFMVIYVKFILLIIQLAGQSVARLPVLRYRWKYYQFKMIDWLCSDGVAVVKGLVAAQKMEERKEGTEWWGVLLLWWLFAGRKIVFLWSSVAKVKLPTVNLFENHSQYTYVCVH